MSDFSRTPRSLLLVISGPSGVGKSTVINKLLSSEPLKSSAEFSVSVTTRKPRPGEKDGENYRFVSRGEFEKLRDGGHFAEWAVVHDELYGTPKSEIDRILGKGKDVVLELDVQGGRSLRGIYPDAVMIFLEVTEGEYRRRIRARDSGLSEEELEKEIGKRMESEKEERKAKPEYEYVIVNDDLEKTMERLHSIIEDEKRRAMPAKGDE